MVGKTNLAFISKGDSSSVQLIQKSYATDATGEIYKMEVIHNKFFAFVGNKYNKKNVLMGTNAGDMSFIRKGNELLEATHIIYIEGKYYIVQSCTACTEIYETIDFEEYMPLNLAGIEGKWVGIFIDSRGEVVLASYTDDGSPRVRIYVCESLKEMANVQVSEGSFFSEEIEEAYNTCLINNRIYYPDGKQISLSGGSRRPDENYGKWNRHNYAGGYFFTTQYESQKRSIYRSRDMVNNTRYPYNIVTDALDIPDIIPISGSYCYLYETNAGNYINISNDILRVGHPDNEKIEIGDSMEISSVLENDGKTFIGTANGTIYELQLDYEGIIQRPDVAIVKTLAAKQALAQALQYTDDCVAEVKSYIDNKIREELSAAKNNLTEVES